MPFSDAPVIVVGGGQSGLAAARELRELRVPTVILEASDRPTGSWPRYYDSLRVFSPAGYSSMPGMPFPGDPDHYPGRDEVADYLERYAAQLDVEVQTDTRVETIQQDGNEFIVLTEGGGTLRASGVVAASGSFSNPYLPSFPGEEAFTGEISHVAVYRNPAPYVGQRVIVVGAGDSAAQVANELAPVATVTLATRHPMRFIPQRLGGQDIHYWLRETGFDTLPAGWLSRITRGSVVTDSVGFERTLAEGLVDRRPMFTALEGRQVVWSDGQREPVDAIILATGYRPSLGYLRELGALDAHAAPIHVGGISSTHPRLGVPRSRVPALVCLQYPQGRQRRRPSGHRPTRRLDPRRANPGRTQSLRTRVDRLALSGYPVSTRRHRVLTSTEEEGWRRTSASSRSRTGSSSRRARARR